MPRWCAFFSCILQCLANPIPTRLMCSHGNQFCPGARCVATASCSKPLRDSSLFRLLIACSDISFYIACSCAMTSYRIPKQLLIKPQGVPQRRSHHLENVALLLTQHMWLEEGVYHGLELCSCNYCTLTIESAACETRFLPFRAPCSIQSRGQEQSPVLLITGPGPRFHFDHIPCPTVRPLSPWPAAILVEFIDTLFAPYQLPNFFFGFRQGWPDGEGVVKHQFGIPFDVLAAFCTALNVFEPHALPSTDGMFDVVVGMRFRKPAGWCFLEFVHGQKAQKLVVHFDMHVQDFQNLWQKHLESSNP